MKQLLVKVLSIGMIMTMATVGLCGCGDKNGMAGYAKKVEEIQLPENVKVAALGEATHGNKEFQKLKLDVFAHLVETTRVRGFALEADFSGCAVANDYIVNNEGNAQDAVESLGFQIYRTDEMLELIEWMHDYNKKAEEQDKVRFYGFDMQRTMPGIARINEFYRMTDSPKAQDFEARLEKLYGTKEYSFDVADVSDMKALLEEIMEDMTANEETYRNITGEEDYAYTLQAVKCLLQHAQLQTAGADYNEIRDKYMAENVEWILNREESIYGTKLMLSGHNGHVAKDVNSNYTNMGHYLSEEMQEEYFVIGTDFYQTTCNIANEEGRGSYEFCSDDPIAQAVGELEENIYYLDFAEAADSKQLSEIINNRMKMGSLGEGYSPLMEISKSMYQIEMAPGSLYDGMIFVYEATPIEVWETE